MAEFDYGKALAAMWADNGKAMLSAQEEAARLMREGAAAMARAAAAAVPGAGASGFPGGFGPAAGGPGMAGAAPGVGSPAGMAEFGRAGEVAGELWSAARELSAALARKLPDVAGGDDDPATGALRRMLDPRSWMSGGGEVDDALRRFAEGPQFADLWEVERKYARTLGLWTALRRRSLEHSAVLLEGWIDAGRRFGARLEALGAENKAPDTPRRRLDLWVETANAALLEMQHSERFLASQASLLSASTELRFAQRELAEHYGEGFGFPTRRELDDVHRIVTELRRELRALRREVGRGGAARGDVAAAPSRPAAVPEVAPEADTRIAPKVATDGVTAAPPEASGPPPRPAAAGRRGGNKNSGKRN